MAQLKDNSTMGGALLAKDIEKADDPHDNTQHSVNYTTTSPGDVTSSNWGDYEIQKNGTDGNGIINFKTS